MNMSHIRYPIEYFVLFYKDASNENFHEGGNNFNLKWDILRYIGSTIYGVLGLIVLYPLLVKKTWTSRTRRLIILTDFFLFVSCPTSGAAIYFKSSAETPRRILLALVWKCSEYCQSIGLITFLFVLHAVTNMENVQWKRGNSLILFIASWCYLIHYISIVSCIIESHYHIAYATQSAFTLVEGITFFLMGLCYTTIGRKIRRNHKPTVTMFNELGSHFREQSSVLVEDEKNFYIMIYEITAISVFCFLQSTTKCIISFRKMEHSIQRNLIWDLSDWEIWVFSLVKMICEVAIVSLLFCLAFCSPQHRQAARVWLQNFISRDIEMIALKDLRRSSYMDDEFLFCDQPRRARADTNETIVSDTSIESGLSADSPKRQIILYTDSEEKQSNRSLQVSVNSLPNTLQVPVCSFSRLSRPGTDHV